jgi:hypothetical protein
MPTAESISPRRWTRRDGGVLIRRRPGDINRSACKTLTGSRTPSNAQSIVLKPGANRLEPKGDAWRRRQGRDRLYRRHRRSRRGRSSRHTNGRVSRRWIARYARQGICSCFPPRPCEIGYFERQNMAIDYGRTKRSAPASIHGQTTVPVHNFVVAGLSSASSTTQSCAIPVSWRRLNSL